MGVCALQKWTRPIFGATVDYKKLAEVERKKAKEIIARKQSLGLVRARAQALRLRLLMSLAFAVCYDVQIQTRHPRAGRHKARNHSGRTNACAHQLRCCHSNRLLRRVCSCACLCSRSCSRACSRACSRVRRPRRLTTLYGQTQCWTKRRRRSVRQRKTTNRSTRVWRRKSIPELSAAPNPCGKPLSTSRAITSTRNVDAAVRVFHHRDMSTFHRYTVRTSLHVLPPRHVQRTRMRMPAKSQTLRCRTLIFASPFGRACRCTAAALTLLCFRYRTRLLLPTGSVALEAASRARDAEEGMKRCTKQNTRDGGDRGSGDERKAHGSSERR